jgi:hypothetical protein
MSMTLARINRCSCHLITQPQCMSNVIAGAQLPMNSIIKHMRESLFVDT